MAIISGVTVRWGLSPRLIVIPVAETAVDLSDLQDTLQDIEDDSQGMPFNKLRSMTGGQELDATTNVGFTMQLNDAQLVWETYVSALDSGTITTPDTDGLSLIDSTGLFVTNGVEAGDMVVNSTDGSHATILSVVSETEVLVDVLVGGIDNQFDSADSYTIFDWQLRALTGGNLVAVNGSGTPISPVLNSFGNSYDRTSSSSATVSELGDIQHASFDGGVHVDVTSSQTGSAYPSGNSANPVNNWADAAVVNTREGFDHYFVEKSTTLDVAENYDFAKFEGRSVISTVLTIPTGASISTAEFFFVSLEGTLGDTTMIRDCFLGETNSVENVRGRVERSSIGPALVVLGGSNTTTVYFTDCRGAGEDVSPVTISGNGDGPKLDMQNHTGTLTLKNKTGDAFWDIQINGDVTLDSTCTGGIVRITGNGNITDNSGVGCTVIDNMLDPERVTEMWQLQGLEINNPMTVTEALRSTSDGAISLELTGDGVTTTTVTRQIDTTITLDAPLTADLVDLSTTSATPTFTSGAGTYVGPLDGLITTAAINTPRFESVGLLVEGARTNLIFPTESFSNTGSINLWKGAVEPASVAPSGNEIQSWKGAGEPLEIAKWQAGNATIVVDQAVAPDGTTTADQLIDNSAGGTGQVSVSIDALTDGSSQYTYEVFAEADQLDWIFLQVVGSAITDSCYFDLTNTAIGTSTATDAGIEDYGSGRRRCWITYTSDQASISHKIQLADADLDNVVDLDGTSSAFIWGANTKASEFPTSYIPATSASVARSADFLSYAEDDTIIDVAGSCFVEFTPLFRSDISNDAVIVNIADQLIGPLYITDDTTQKVAIGDGTNTATYDPTFVSGQTYKIASRWNASLNEMQIIVDGVAGTIQPYDGASARTLGTLYVGSDSTGNHVNGNIRNLKIYGIDKGEDQLKVETG